MSAANLCLKKGKIIVYQIYCCANLSSASKRDFGRMVMRMGGRVALRFVMKQRNRFLFALFIF